MENIQQKTWDFKTAEILIREVFGISFQICSAEHPEKIRPDNELLFTDQQFMKAAALKELINDLNENEIAVIIDQLFVTWFVLRDAANVYLAGPMLLFSASITAIRGALADSGFEKDSLDSFLKYQSHIPNIEDNSFKGLINVLSRLFLDTSVPELRWVELYQREIHPKQAEATQNDYVQNAYEIESEYLEAVYAGDTQGALDALSHIQNRYRHSSAPDPNPLISSIYGNAINCTMARIAAYQAGVSPIVLDKMFQEFMIRSVNGKSVEDQFRQAFRMTALVCEQVQNTKTAGFSPIICQAITYILANYRKEVSLSQTAKLLGINKNYLSSQFTKETGKTFSEYLLKLRLTQAALRVGMSMEPIGGIAAAFGFPDQNYFSRMFKREFGESPSAYRKQRHKK